MTFAILATIGVVFVIGAIVFSIIANMDFS
jgi:hypothetical protein